MKMTLGETVKQWRTAVGLTQIELHEKSGVGLSSICELERGVRKNPSVRQLARLADALGIPRTILWEAAVR